MDRDTVKAYNTSLEEEYLLVLQVDTILTYKQKVAIHCYYNMSHCTHSRFTNGILYSLLLLLLLTCPMKREIKQRLDIPVRTVGLIEINNNSLCINLISKTTSTVKQKQESPQKLLFVSPFSQSVALFAAANATRQKVYGDKNDWGPFYLFIQYRKLLI